MKLIVYDFDGTLVDSRRDIAAAVNHMRRSLGAEDLTLEEVLERTGNGADDLVRRSIADIDAEFPVARALLGKYYAAHPMDHTILYPGVAEGLKRIQQKGIRQVLVSNKVEALCRMCLDGLKVSQYLDEIIGDGRYRLKPDPEPLLAVQEKFGVKTEDCLMFGDNWTDLAAGRKAGFKRVFATYGFGELGQESYDCKAGSFDEFVDMVLSEA